MPSFSFNQSPERDKLIESILPKKSIVDDFLQPRLMEAMNDVLVKALKQEIEVYKKFPKQGEYKPDSFDTRSPDTCFMGQGFRANGIGMEGWYDVDLKKYRQAVGTIAHQEWGSCTLLEIWGGDHFNSHKEMVTGVMRYAWGKSKFLPDIQFYVNPFFKNSSSGQMVLSEKKKEDHENAFHMNKIASYLEIRDRMKKAGIDSPLQLGLTEEDDPQPKQYKKRYEEDEEEDD